jgi:hypothetical protein
MRKATTMRTIGEKKAADEEGKEVTCIGLFRSEATSEWARIRREDKRKKTTIKTKETMREKKTTDCTDVSE